jgi:predicted acetyltransferase
MALVVRPTEPHEYRTAATTMSAALLMAPIDDAGWERWRAGWETGHLSITSWDGDRCVGHAGAFEVTTLVPGGAWLPTSAVTRVGVLPTHTRQGALNGMLRELLDRHRASGCLLASLRASEAVIYGRFGFGVAGDTTAVVVRTADALPIRGAAAGSFRLLTHAEATAQLPAIYERAAHRPGAISRSPFFWDRALKDALEGDRAGFTVVHTSPDGIDDGFATYTLAWEENEFSDNLGQAKLHDLFGASPEVELALWQYVLAISLVRTATANDRPVDDLVRIALADPRVYEVKQRWDEQWVRLLHVEAALAARTYAQGEPFTVTVDDPWYADNCGTFRIGPDGVSRVDGDGELHAGIDAISSAYLGGVAWRDLRSVDRVTGSADAAARADVLFAHHPTTWSGTFF